MRLGNLLVLLFSFSLVQVANASLVGTWRSIDDVTGKPRSIVVIKQLSSGEFQGRIKKVLQVDDNPPKKFCSQCPGELKNKPIQGMVIIWGLKQDGENSWDDGQILDPKTGNIYSLSATLSEDGNELNMRGYIGISLFGRTQIWYRMK